MEFQNKLDGEVVDEAKEGNSRAQDHLISKYESFIRAKAKSCSLIGTDKKDIYQESTIGLYKAIRDFKFDRLTGFRALAELRTTRQTTAAIRTAARRKRVPSNAYISLNKLIHEEESDRTLIDVLLGLKMTDPEELIVGKGQLKHIEGEMAKVLSDLEMKVLQSYLDKEPYQEIIYNLDRQAKSIGSALQRVKRKFEKCLYTEK